MKEPIEDNAEEKDDFEFESDAVLRHGAHDLSEELDNLGGYANHIRESRFSNNE